MAPKGVKRSCPAAAEASMEPSSKRVAFDSAVEKRCAAVSKLVSSAKQLPADCRDMFVAMILHCLNVTKEERHDLQAQMVASLEEVLEETEVGLRKDTADIQAQVDGAAGTAKVTEDALGPELEATEQALKNTKELMQSIFAPLKDGTVTDQKCLDALAASLKPLALDQSLTDAMRVPLAKPVAERSGFDDIVVQQLEAAIAKHIEGLAGKIDQAEQLKAERGAAVGSASSALEACKAAQNKREGKEVTAEEEAAHATIEWRAAKKAVKALGPQLRKAETALARSSAALSRFLEARGEFEALRDLAGPPEEEEEAAQETAAGAAAAAQAA